MTWWHDDVPLEMIGEHHSFSRYRTRLFKLFAVILMHPALNWMHGNESFLLSWA